VRGSSRRQVTGLAAARGADESRDQGIGQQDRCHAKARGILDLKTSKPCGHHRLIVAGRRAGGFCASPSRFIAVSPYATLENRIFNCLNLSPYRRSQAKRLLSMTKSSQSSSVESTGVTATVR
jgi:hypothetical protein